MIGEVVFINQKRLDKTLVKKMFLK
eukprot:COSAG01_NODE_75826_length_192_cov_89.129032_1_plen_24_part_10